MNVIQSDYSLDKTSYTWKNAFLWGNFRQHCQKANTGSLGHRVVHALIAAAEILPIIGQIASIFEKIIVINCILPKLNPEKKLQPDALLKSVDNLIKASKKSDEIMKKNNQLFNENIDRQNKLFEDLKSTKETLRNELLASRIENFSKIISKSPKFDGYKIFFSNPSAYNGLVLTGVSLRPANLFLAELFKDTDIKTTLPGKGLFAFNKPQEEIREYIRQKAKENPQGIVTVSTIESGKPKIADLAIQQQNAKHEWLDVPLTEIFGENVYQISYAEIWNILESQKIYTSSMLPLPFYKGLKKAMKADKIVELPGNERDLVLLKELNGEMGKFIAEVKANPLSFGFKTTHDFENLLSMTIYQIGSMVVKSEDYHIFVDGNFKLLERKPGTKDAIHLINACGIRGINQRKTPQEHNKKIMTETFKTALTAAEKNIVIFPAVGMGVWGGDPDLYWKAFLDAVIHSSDTFELICINPRHQKTQHGKYQGKDGAEFQQILNEYKDKYTDDTKAFAKLSVIYNLYDSQSDVVQLAYNIKKEYPDKIVSLFNASDPDVTLGYHVGEYTNNLPHFSPTTEENYTAMGTNGLCFEGITGVHESPGRCIQT